jgi:hypothetical protein
MNCQQSHFAFLPESSQLGLEGVAGTFGDKTAIGGLGQIKKKGTKVEATEVRVEHVGKAEDVAD